MKTSLEKTELSKPKIESAPIKKDTMMLMYVAILMVAMMAAFLIWKESSYYSQSQSIDSIYLKEKTYFVDNPGAVCEFRGNFIGGKKSVDVYYCENKLSTISQNNERLIVYMAKNGTILSDRLETEDKSIPVLLRQVDSK